MEALQLIPADIVSPEAGHGPSHIPKALIDEAQAIKVVSFDPKKHLAFEHPRKIHLLKDLGIADDNALSPIAVTEPFQFFTEEAISQMRREVLNEEVLNQRYCPTSPTSGQLRGYASSDTPFIYSAWKSPELIEYVSSLASVDVVPAIDYDIGHVNIAYGEVDTRVVLASGEQTDKSNFCECAFGWHTDSYPFVVVTMLSPCVGMMGGETEIRKGDGTIMKARGLSLGTAVVMQGSKVPHRATAALGGHERISMITSFRPKSPFLKDLTITRGTRNVSHLPTLYYQYASYRLENLEARVKDERMRMQTRWKDKSNFDVSQVREWMLEQQAYLEAMLLELTVDERLDGRP